MNDLILSTALLNGIDVTFVNVKENTVTKLEAIHNTPYADTLEIAGSIAYATLDQGGATYFHDPVAGWLPYEGDGYAVGGYQDTVTVYLGDHADVDPAPEIARFIERIPTDIAGRRKYSLGTWINDGTLHIDAVIVWADIENAIVEGQRLGQYSVYGFREGREFVCSEYEVVDGEVFEKATGRNVLTLEPIDQLVDESEPDDDARYEYPDDLVSIGDVLAYLNDKLASFTRISNDFRDDGNPEVRNHNLAIQFDHYARCLEVQIIPGIEEKFGNK